MFSFLCLKFLITLIVWELGHLCECAVVCTGRWEANLVRLILSVHLNVVSGGAGLAQHAPLPAVPSHWLCW